MVNGSGEVTADAVYSELYEEGRYFRNHELTVSTWYSIILLAILAAVLAVKSSSPDSSIYQVFSNNLPTKACIAIVILIIGTSGLLSIRYSEIRYKDIRKHLNSMEPSNKNLQKTPIKICGREYTPRKLLSLSLFILMIVGIVVVFIP
jgi:hypothetical protein